MNDKKREIISYLITFVVTVLFTVCLLTFKNGSKLDLNKDGTVNNKDLEVIRNIIDGKEIYTSSIIDRSDLNKDGVVDVKDLAIMKRELLERGVTNEDN